MIQDKDVLKNLKCKPPMPYIGGKTKLSKQIIAHFPEQNIALKKRKNQYFVVPFFGAGGLFVENERWANCEVINDRNDDIANLFIVIQNHPEEFCKTLEKMPNSETIFNRYLNTDKMFLTDIQKAVKTYYLHCHSFSANTKFYSPKPRSRENAIENIMKVSKRLETVSIMNQDFAEIIKRFDRENVFLYLDPPYYEKEYLYQEKFSKKRHEELRDLLKTFKGQFCLSYNNVPEIKELYKEFKIIKLETTYSCFQKTQQETTELLIKNY
ncbi:MAG: hypothetical protein A2086_11640 [Spirochaetes bacterium GWD1_27_9]|nr:MAG: hypothetical protein A2Z98_12065 [Spirochaetes bacterium GWB1_27_13]OHD26449.1 MAG: hypothetical protein A2Y34_10090 [Spirochaetes bacterium GWC1_27_15]OHD36385.1 MAG: hypothetical protein A2086_11640 [Spirochaetes bacterium GWD1_27_9]